MVGVVVVGLLVVGLLVVGLGEGEGFGSARNQPRGQRILPEENFMNGFDMPFLNLVMLCKYKSFKPKSGQTW